MIDPDALKLGLAANTYEGFEVRLRELVHDWKPKKIQAKGRFFYLSFRGAEPTLDDFATYIYHKIIPFCIPRAERKRVHDLFTASNDERHWQELADRARNLFVKAAKSRLTSGEPGEVILFILLEAVLNAPQVACKMYLKTSENVPVHGSDSVHMLYDAASEKMLVFWGESKLKQDLASALDDTFESIKKFTTPKEGRAPRDRDIDVLIDHPNIDDPIQRKAFLDFFNPYSESSNNRTEIFACLTGFNYPACTSSKKQKPEEAEQWFKGKYLSRVQSACDLFEDKVIASGLQNCDFSFFLLPFEDVEKLREAFFLKLGIQ